MHRKTRVLIGLYRNDGVKAVRNATTGKKDIKISPNQYFLQKPLLKTCNLYVMIDVHQILF